MKRVAIVGGGIAALGCAVALKERGIACTIFEKERGGAGKLRTERAGAFLIEAGPDSFLPEKPWTLELIRTIGLEHELLCSNDEHKGTYIWSRGRLHRLPDGVALMVPTMIGPMLRSRLISWRGKLRMGLDLVVRRRRDESDESLESFVTRRLGRECLDKIAEPLVAGIHTSNPDNMSVRATFPRFVEMERKHRSLIRAMLAAKKRMPPPKPGARPMTYFMSLRSGMQALADGCAAFVGRDAFRSGTPVRRLARAGDGWRLALDDGKATFDHVVCAVPSYDAAGLLGELDGGLAAAMAAIEWSSSANVSLGFRREDVRVELPGFGFIVPRVEDRRINATTWSSIKWSHRAPDDHVLVRAFVGGGHHEELVELGDEDLVRVLREELRSIVGLEAEPVLTRIHRWPRSMPKYTVGHLERIEAIEGRVRAFAGLHLCGCSYRGIGIGDCVHSGFEAAKAIAGA
ncbi:MAG: protoporphyrinogen oxidase [Deltaproteobacteria bacterium]|nr:protoporphyrinogen oxidase [Deltaproteobacteria bacterium]